MERRSIVALVFVAAACAHASRNAAVHVTVNASEGVARRVDTPALQRVTEEEVQRSGSARPLTLTVFFDSFGFVERPYGPDQQTHGSKTLVTPQAVSDLSATPWEDGLIVQHGDDARAGSIENRHYRREVVVGTYTISDETGKVIEQRPVVVGATSPEIAMLPLQVRSTQTTGHYLASRVAAVSR
ncbi:MAG TPA: hypothetical protein VHY33_00320 [Thermoanaerobaculia bacterium]|jgi:hypothetical protein|nr:hypothetical protein [Thermoanaerobaculia bacterium]